MRIVFMGTPDFAVPSLQRLLQDGHTIAGVFTQPDKPAGRGHKLLASPVKMLALEHGIPVFQPSSLRNAEALAAVQELAPELIVVVAYGKILPPAVLELPKYGCINVHGSLLPKYRGAAPIQQSVLDGEKVTGVTTMFMAEGIDTGDILLQRETEIGENETAGELFDRLALMGGELLAETLAALAAGNLRPVKQEEEKASYASMLSREMAKIDWDQDAGRIHCLIRGLSPWPCAETTLQGKRLKIYRSEIVLDKSGKPGTLLSEKECIVACRDAALRLTEVQYEGSRRMDGGDFLRGKRLKAGEQLG